MKTSLMVLIGIVALTSCTTPYDLKRTEPVITFTSSKLANEIKKCILKSWRTHLTSVEEEKTATGFLIRHNDAPSSTIAIVTIDGEAPEVKVNYYHRMHQIKLHRLEEEVSACK